MKKLLNKISVFALIGAAMGLGSCAETPADIIDTIDLNRCLAPMEFEAKVVATTGTDVVLEWEATTGTDYYEVELFEAAVGTDEEGKEIAVAPDYTATPVANYEVQPDEVPYTIKGLDVDKSFYARVRGCAAPDENGVLSKDPSHWTYLEEEFSTYPVRSSLNPKVVSRGESTLSITWDAAADKEDLNSYTVVPVLGGQSVKASLSAEQIEACALTVENLEPCTEYLVTLIYGKAGERGSVAGWTRPSTSGATEVTTADALVAAITGATGDIELKLPYNDGIPYDIPSSLAPAYGVTIYGIATDDGKKPIITGLEYQPTANISTIHFEDVVLDGAVNAVADAAPRGNIIIATTAIETIEFVNCEIYGYTKGFIYVSNSSSAFACSSFLVEGCYAHDICADGTGGGDFIDIRAGQCPSIVIKNSTFASCARTFLRISDNADSDVIDVANCTFNMVTSTISSSNNAGIFGVRTKTTPSQITCTNNVFLNEYHDNEDQSDASKCWVILCRNSSDSNAPVCSGNYYNVGAAWFTTNPTQVDGTAFSEDAALAGGGKILTIDPCQNSLANKLYLNETSDIAASKKGDPRWWNAAIPAAPVRATELEMVEAPITWDFTVKSKFDSEELSQPTIIENIRIYGSAEAPANVVMGQGIQFSQSSVSNADGTLVSGGLEFLCNGVGSVKVIAESDGGRQSVQVVAGGDVYTVLADGEEHTVVYGDLAGDNNVYVLAGGPLTMKQITWSNDLTPDATAEALAKPGVTLDNRKVDLGTAQAVVASWAAVENAATYEVTWRGAVTVLDAATTSFTIAAEEVAALTAGEYVMTVVAKPVETSTKFLASEAGEATLSIVKPVVGGEVTLTWDFSSEAWASALETIGTSDNTTVDLTVDDLRVYAGGDKMKAGSNYIQMGGKSSGKTRLFIFTAPASGTLKVWSSNTGSSEDLTRLVTAANGTEDVADTTTAQTNPGGTPSNADPTVSTFDIDITKGNQVFIYPQGNGLRFYKIEYTYVQAAPKAHYVWDFASAEWLDTLVGIGTSNKTDVEVTVDGLSVISGGGSIKASDTTAGQYYIQPGGKGDANKRYFCFTAPGAGTLKVWTSNTGSSEATDRFVAVQQGEDSSTLVEKVGGSPSNADPTENEFDVQEGEIRIWASGNALRFYKFEYIQD